MEAINLLGLNSVTVLILFLVGFVGGKEKAILESILDTERKEKAALAVALADS